jgi:hypothetical protein
MGTPTVLASRGCSPSAVTDGGEGRGVNWREIQLAASHSRYFLFPALNGRTINSGVS